MHARYNSNQTDTSFRAVALVFIAILAIIVLIALICWLLVTPETRTLA